MCEYDPNLPHFFIFLLILTSLVLLKDDSNGYWNSACCKSMWLKKDDKGNEIHY